MTGTRPGLGAAAVGGVAWTLLRTLVSRLLGAAVFIVLARLLDPVAFGVVALASVFVALLTLVVEAGFAEALVQRDELREVDLDTAFWLTSATGVLLAGSMALAAPLVSDLVHLPALGPVLAALSVVLVFAGLSSVPLAMLRRSLAFRSIALRGMAATAAGGAVGIALAVRGAGAWSLVGQLVANALVGTVALWALCDWRPGRSFSVESARFLVGFGAKVLGGRAAQLASRRSDDLLVGLVLGARALGLYAVAYRLLLIVTEVVVFTIETVAFPVLARMQSDASRARRAFYRLSQAATAAAVPPFAALAVLAPEVVRLVFGEQWSGAVPVMQVLALVGIPHATTYCIKAAINAAGRPELSLQLALLSAVVNVAAFVLVVRWGIVAVALSYVVCEYLLAPVAVWQARRALGIEVRRYARLLVAPVVSGLAMVIALLGWTLTVRGELSDAAVVAVAVPLGALTYLTALALTGRDFLRTAVADVRGAVARV